MKEENGLLNELRSLVQLHPKNYVRMLKSKGVHKGKCKDMSYLHDYVIEKTSQLARNYNYKFKTRIYWLLNGIESWDDDRVRCAICEKPLHEVDVKNIVVGYVRKTCSKECERALAQKHNEEHMEKVHGVKNAFQLNDVKMKLCAKKDDMQKHRDATHRKNKTFKTSKQEEHAYEVLCNMFGKDNVIRQFKSDAYPFNCDFYIKSIDTYIECNFSWTHGGHWFNENDEDDLKKLEKWKSKKTKYYDNAIETWTVRDVKKRKCAEDSHLKYIALWKLDDIDNFTP